MSVSAMFGTRVVATPAPASLSSSIAFPIGSSGLTIECSSRPKKKATAHHIKTRPRKTQPWDIKRKPTVYPPLPPLPPDWTLVIPAADHDSSDDAAAAAPPPPPVPSL